MDEDLRVDVDVDDPGLGSVTLRDLVDVVRGRQTAAEVDELPDAGGLHDLPDRAGQGSAVGEGDGHRAGQVAFEHVTDLSVHGVVVLAAQQIVVDARDAGLGRVDGGAFVRHDAHFPRNAPC
ncbi:hypothetical protein RKD19_000641 [Streptomyces canus]